MPTLIGIVISFRLDSARCFGCGSDSVLPAQHDRFDPRNGHVVFACPGSARPSIHQQAIPSGRYRTRQGYADLQAIVRACRALTYRGGVDADVETQNDIAEEFDLPTSTTVALPS